MDSLLKDNRRALMINHKAVVNTVQVMKSLIQDTKTGEPCEK